MAERIGTRQSPMVVALLICFVCAVILTMTTSVASADSHDSLHRSRPASSFVRKSLEARRQSTMMSSTAVYNPFKVMSSGSVSSRIRRLAVAANCTATPSICNDVTTYGANATCCASTGACAQLQTDITNCGFCMYSCAPTLGCCGGTCTSVQTDTQNCGTCGTTCKNSLCTSGLCGYGG